MYKNVICPALSGTDRQKDIKPAGKRYPAAFSAAFWRPCDQLLAEQRRTERTKPEPEAR